VRVLDAGCGRLTQAAPPGAHVAGIDIDEAGLAANTDLDEKIVGSIESYPLPPNSFDLIYCHDVLEHLENPIAALDNLVQALAPGGELHVGVPDVTSRKSLIAKFTPHVFHVTFYRFIGFRHAGEPGYGPFKTYLRWSIRPTKLMEWASGRGLDVVSYDKVRGAAFASRPLLRLVGGDATECRFVFRRQL
jgi:SAM-dependent methyltransferase